MAGQQDRAARLLRLGDRPLEDDLHQRIQACRGLVEQQQLDVRDQRGDQRDLLPVALRVGAGLLGRIQIEPLAQLGAARAIQSAAEPGEQVDGLAAGQVRPEVDVAGDVGQSAVQCDGIAPRVAAEQPHRTRVGAQQAEQDPHRGGLARSVGAEEAVHLAGCDCQVQSVQGAGTAERLDQSVRRDHRVV